MNYLVDIGYNSKLYPSISIQEAFFEGTNANHVDQTIEIHDSVSASLTDATISTTMIVTSSSLYCVCLCVR